MMTTKQEKMWEAIKDSCQTVEDAMCFFSNYCGLQIFDDEMWEYLVKNEILEEEEEDDKPDLPNEFMVFGFTIADDFYDLDEDGQSEAISNYLSDEYEYCHNGFRFEETKNFLIHIYDIQWDTEE
jgi:hypothetical protein